MNAKIQLKLKTVFEGKGQLTLGVHWLFRKNRKLPF